MAKRLGGEVTKQCFFITPIGEAGSVERQRADWVYHHVVEPASAENSLIASRADLMVGAAMIGTNIFRALSQHEVCVADLTGLNPNVLYEMGVRHCLRLPIIHIAQVGTKLPFDTAPHQTHFYDLADYGSMNRLQSTISAEMEHVLGAGYEVTNPFTQALGALEIRASGDPRDQVMSTILERVDSLERSARDTRYHRSRSMEETTSAAQLERFIMSAMVADRPYNEETFREAVADVKDDFNLLGRLREALESTSRPNKAALIDIVDDYLPF
ncbi:hypothetical protein D3C80_1197000 [compost metagenome]